MEQKLVYITDKKNIILYKPHRGDIDDSMYELIEFNSIDEMLAYVKNKNNYKKELTYKWYYGYDDRIGWQNTYILSNNDMFTVGITKEESLLHFYKWRKKHSSNDYPQQQMPPWLEMWKEHYNETNKE